MDKLPKLNIKSIPDYIEESDIDLTACENFEDLISQSLYQCLDAPRINYNLEKAYKILRNIDDTKEFMINIKEVSALINKFDYYKLSSILPPSMLLQEKFYPELKEMSLFPLYDDDMKNVRILAKIFRFNTDDCLIAWRMLCENKFCTVLTTFASLETYNKRSIYTPQFTPIYLAK